MDWMSSRSAPDAGWLWDSPPPRPVRPPDSLAQATLCRLTGARGPLELQALLGAAGVAYRVDADGVRASLAEVSRWLRAEFQAGG